MYSVFQHWDPLKVCVVGRSYPPEFYSWIDVPHVRTLFEKIAVETEEDYQNIIKKLQEFNVEILRPDLPESGFDGTKYVPPPMTPRDYTLMLGTTFYQNYNSYDFGYFYHQVKEQKKWHWWCKSFEDLDLLPADVRDECLILHEQYLKSNPGFFCYDKIFEHIKNQGHTIKHYFNTICSGGFVSRLGKDLYFGTQTNDQNLTLLTQQMNQEFLHTRNHVINTGGHIDGVFCPVAPGLVVGTKGAIDYDAAFPGWEIVCPPLKNLHNKKEFLDLKKKNKGKWWIPGFEYDQDVLNIVHRSLDTWTGYVEESVFDVNVLIVNPKNIITNVYNKQIFDAYERHGITPHLIPLRHQNFWDGGIHCVTSDLHREGAMQDYFPERNT
jgi:N-dimethylarginine dimethylaminohydrolase